MKKLTIRLNDDLYKQMTDKKKSLNFNKTNDFFKSLITQEQVYSNSIRRYILLYSNFTNNFNQLTHKMNTNNISNEEFNERLEKLEKIQRILFKYVSRKFN